MANPVFQGIIKPTGLEGLKGLRSWGELSQEEQSSWLESHPSAQKVSPLKMNVAYRNNQYLEALGESVYFDKSYDMDTLGEMYRDKVVNTAFNDYYGNDSNFNLLNSFTTDSKQELLESGYLNEEENEKLVDSSYKEYEEGMKKAAPFAPAAPGGGFTWETKEEWAGENAFVRNKQLDALIAKDNKRKVAASQEDIDGLYKLYTENQTYWGNANNMFQADLEGNGDLDEVIEYMGDNRIITPAQAQTLIGKGVEQKANLIGEILQKSEFNPGRIDALFDTIALPQTIQGYSEFGEVEDYQMPGSRTYNALHSTDRFKDFGASDKLREYVTWQVLANKYGTMDAVSNLETAMTDYAHENEGLSEWASDVFLNVTLGGVANIMNKVNAINNLVQSAGEGGQERLANLLSGKNADGTEREQTENGNLLDWFSDNWDNPYYWSKVDQYNTLDPLQIAEIDSNGGISPFVTVRPPDEVVPFFSTETLKEALKMAKFAWSDYLTGQLLGAATKGLTIGANAIGSYGLSKFVGKAGAIANVAASAMGISESYGVMTYEQTYQEMMEALDARRDALASQNANDLLHSPEGQAQVEEVVQRLMKQQEDANLGKENPMYVTEEDIRKQVEADFLNYHTQQYHKSDEATESRNQDKEFARKAAANAYMVDATIEELRMSIVNFTFKKYLFDKGTRASLGDNASYSQVEVQPDGTLGLANEKLNRAWAVLKPVWGGFESNYFDDVTVGFGKGFGLEQYNAYLQDKYDAGKGAVNSDYALSFLTGLGGGYEGAMAALGDRQSFYDGFVGALGTPFSATLRLTSSERNATVEAMNRQNAENLTFGERINKNFANPLIQAYYEERGNQERTKEVLKVVNDEIAKHKTSLEDINQMLIGLNNVAEENTKGSHLNRKDAKDKQAFNLLLTMRGLTSAPLISEHPLIQNAASEIDRLASGKVTEEEVATFLAQPGNQNFTPKQATERIRQNAKSLQDMNNRIIKAQEILENSILGQSINPDLKEQFMFQLAMDDTWNERFSSIEESLTGARKAHNDHNAIAAYGNKAEFERQLNAQRDELSSLRDRLTLYNSSVKALRKQYKEERSVHPRGSETERLRNSLLEGQLRAETLRETIREAETKLREMERDATIFDSEEVPVLTAQQILALNPVERNTILSDENRSNYSDAQLVTIDEAMSELLSRTPDAVQSLKDASTLYTRIRDNKKAYSRMQKNPDAASAYASTILSSRADQLARAFTQKRIDETYEVFDRAKDDAELLVLAKNALNSRELGMKSSHIDAYIKKNPNKEGILKGLSEVSKIREDAYNALNYIIKDSKVQRPLIQQIVNATNDANNGAEAMSALEGILDIQTDPTAKLQFDRVLEKLKEFGHQRDATKVRDRELERQKKQEAELKRIEEEKKKDGKNYGWDGYKVGDTVYNKETGNSGVVIGFEKTQSGENKMLIQVKYSDNVVGTIRYDSVTGKDKITKEQPKPVETAPEGAQQVFDDTTTGNPNEASEYELASVEDVEISVDAEGAVESPSVEKQAAAAQSPVIEVPESDPTDQGNNIVEDSPTTISGNRWVTYSIDALKDGVVREEVPENPNSVFGKFVEWLHNNKIKLQEIIDEEFGRIITDNPDIDIRFMKMKTDSDIGYKLQNVLFNVIELTPALRKKYHDESRGGVIQANGKSWLVVGTTGFEVGNTAQMKAFDVMKAPINKRRDAYFNANPTEVYYVDDVAYSRVQNTTSGRIVNQRLGAESPTLKKVSELLKAAGIPLNKASFGVQTKQANDKKGFATTKNAGDKSRIFNPRNAEDNRGRTFVLIDTANGNKIPGMIEPAMYNSIAEGTPLKEMINETLARLFSTSYETRSKAIKELCSFLVLGDEKNILIGTKDSAVITIKQQGMPDITQKLGANFDSAKFFRDLENANFQINVTLSTLENPVMLKLYDDSGALMTSVDSMRTAGMSYSIYMTDTSGKPIVLTPVGNAVPGTGTSEFKTYKSVRVNNTTYEFKNGQWENRNDRSKVEPGSELEISCVYNQAIKENGRAPMITQDGKEYYDFMGTDGKVFLASRDGLGNVRLLSQEASQTIINEIQNRIEQHKRMENLEDVVLDETPTPTPTPTVETITQDQINQQVVGNFETPKPEIKSQKQSEVVKEAKESQSQQRKEVITDIGKKSLAELQNTENLSNFVEVFNSDKYNDALYDILESKGWGVTGTLLDADILEKHGIPTTGITNVESWLDLIRNCR